MTDGDDWLPDDVYGYCFDPDDGGYKASSSGSTLLIAARGCSGDGETGRAVLSGLPGRRSTA